MGSTTIDPQVVETYDAWEAKHYKFQGTKGERLYFDQQKGAGQWILYDPDGTHINTDTRFIDFEIVLPGDGEYWLVLNSLNSSRDYEFQIIEPPELPIETVAFTTVDNEKFIRIQDELVEAGQQKTYVFQGDANQRLWFDSLKNDSYSILLSLYDPNGSLIKTQTTSGDLSAPIILPQAGEYRLVVDGSGNAIGEYDFRLLDLEHRPIGCIPNL